MSSELILMPYKENCKTEGEVLTRIKIARMYFFAGLRQKVIAEKWGCDKNTLVNIISACDRASPEAKKYLENREHIPSEKLYLFDFFKYGSRKPKTNCRSLKRKEEKFIIDKHESLHYGPKRMFRQLKRQGIDMDIFTLCKIKGVYKRNGLKGKRVRTANGERRALYNYDKIEAFEYLQYDTKKVTDLHALPVNIYWEFKNNPELPIYQWTIVDAKTKVRFLAWSHSLNSFFGFKFLEWAVVWLRAHQVMADINVQFDGGSEFCSASERKLATWNEALRKYNAFAYDTGGAKWKQNLVERTHRIDDEEFYCPRGEYIHSKKDFLKEAQLWIFYYNNRSSDGIGLNGISPREKLEQLGYYNAREICNFPCFILEDFYQPLQLFFEIEKSQNVLTPYRNDANERCKRLKLDRNLCLYYYWELNLSSDLTKINFFCH
jgi:putative transposase